MYMYSTTGTSEASQETTVALLQKACEVASVPDEPNSNSSRKQESYPQPREKVMYVNPCYCPRKFSLVMNCSS